jgi:hypothetical protein
MLHIAIPKFIGFQLRSPCLDGSSVAVIAFVFSLQILRLRALKFEVIVPPEQASTCLYSNFAYLSPDSQTHCHPKTPNRVYTGIRGRQRLRAYTLHPS